MPDDLTSPRETYPSVPQHSLVAGFRAGLDPAIVSNPHVLDFYRFWQSRCDGRAMPSRADMDPILMARFLPSLILLRVFRDPLDFEYRIIGEDIISFLGNMTHQRVRQSVLFPVTGTAYANYCFVAEQQRPQFFEGLADTAFKRDRKYTMSRVHCPLAEPGGAVDYIVSCVVFL